MLKKRALEIIPKSVYSHWLDIHVFHIREPTMSYSKILAALMVFLFILLTGCPSRAPVKSESKTDPRAESLSKDSRIDSGIANVPAVLGTLQEFEFTDQNGDLFQSDDLSGKVAIINFIFTTCVGTCPQQSQKMAEIHRRLDAEQVDKGVKLISITVDPNTDTPQVLKNYSKNYDVNEHLWKFLTGSKEEIWKFSKQGLKLPVALTPDDPLIPIAHASKFVLVDRLGRIRGYHDVLEDGVDALWKDLGSILPEFQPNLEKWPDLQSEPELTHLAQPPEILETGWLSELASRERDVLQQVKVRQDFTFVDTKGKSGIAFSPQIVDDQRWRLLVNHYDHGNSISVADVDGDGLSDIYFVSQVGPNELWRNQGNGQFENITTRAGVGLADRVSVAGSFADADNDGDVDLFVTSVRGGNAFFVNDGSGHFHEKTEEAGLDYTGHSSTGTFFDYDQDGLLDLFLTNVGKYTTEEFAEVRGDLCNSQPETKISYYVGRKDAFAGHLKPELTEKSILYRNMGQNRFEDVSQKVGLVDESWAGDSIPIDVNSDGWLDLYVLNMQGSDHLYVNQKGESFSEQTADYFPKTPWGAMGAGVLDYNHDGQFDLMLTDMHSDMSEDIGPDREKLKSRMQWPAEFLQTKQSSIFGNALYKRNADATYSEVSDAVGAENYWPWGLSVGDVNADGYPDVFIASSMCFPYRYGQSSLLLNDNGKRFVDAQFALQIEPRKESEMLAPWFSLNCKDDGSGTPFCQGRSGTVVVWSATGTRSSVFFDFDSDGDLDLVTNEFNTSPRILSSNLESQGQLNFLKIELQGTKSNRNGFGAVVTLKSQSKTQVQVNDGKSGYLSQSVLPLYFGLGESQQVDDIEVRWSSGTLQKLKGPIKANQKLVIVEAEAE